jgi:hypothetical protein
MENFVAFLTTPFVIAGTVILIIWFGLNGYLNPTSWPTWLLGGVSIAILSAIQIPLYRTLLLGSVQRRKRQAKNTHCAISGPGCVAGLFTYGVAILVCALLFWQGGLEGLVIGVVLTPFCCLGVATLITFIGG